jgi:hypothetical protein
MAVFQNKNLVKPFSERGRKIKESLGLSKKSYGTKTDTKI